MFVGGTEKWIGSVCLLLDDGLGMPYVFHGVRRELPGCFVGLRV